MHLAANNSEANSASKTYYNLKELKTGRIDGYDEKNDILIDPVNIFKDYNNMRLGLSGKTRHGEKIIILERKETETWHVVKIKTESGVVGWLSTLFVLEDTVNEKKASPQNTREAQELLAKLGYSPGSPDGLYGPKTANAIKNFQADQKLPQDGQVSENILSLLRKAANDRNTSTLPPTKTSPLTTENSYTPKTTASSEKPEPQPEENAPEDYVYLGSPKQDVIRIQGLPDNIISTPVDHEIWKYGNSEILVSKQDKKVIDWNNKGNIKVRLLVKNTATSSMCFTLGSPKNDVIYIQGRPATTMSLPGNTYEIWEYGISEVFISKATKKVQGWSNSGNLKVNMLPGKHITSSNFYGFLSHQDDVIRLQGTPDSIISNPDFSYDVWEYGSSQVHITKDTKKVENWNNMGDLKVR